MTSQTLTTANSAGSRCSLASSAALPRVTSGSACSVPLPVVPSPAVLLAGVPALSTPVPGMRPLCHPDVAELGERPRREVPTWRRPQQLLPAYPLLEVHLPQHALDRRRQAHVQLGQHRA